TDSHAGMCEELLRLEQRHLDVASHLKDGQVLGERSVHADQAELTLARLEREADVADLHRTRPVEHTRALAEHPLHREHEIGSLVDDCLHLSRAGAPSKPIARSSACPVRNRVFSENCGPISCRPTGRPSESPHGMDSPGRPAMFDGIVSTSERYIASGFAVRSPRRKATVGDVGETRTSKRSKASACSRRMSVRT